MWAATADSFLSLRCCSEVGLDMRHGSCRYVRLSRFVVGALGQLHALGSVHLQSRNGVAAHRVVVYVVAFGAVPVFCQDKMIVFGPLVVHVSRAHGK